MAACNFSRLRSVSHRILIMGLPVLLLVQLLVSLTVPRAYSSKSGDEPAFLVISIKKSDGSASSGVRKNERDLESGVLGLWTDEDSRLTGYQDENELEGRQVIAHSLEIQVTYYLADLGGGSSRHATQKKINCCSKLIEFQYE